MTNGWKIGVGAVAVGIGTYAVLTLLLPHKKEEVVMEGLVPVETVFGEALKSPTEVAAAAPEAQTPDAEAINPTGGESADAAVNSDDAAAAAPAEPVAATPPAEPEPVAEPEPEPAPAPQAAPEPVAPPAPAPAPKAPVKPAVAKPADSTPAKVARASEKAAEATTPWWQSSGGDGLQVVYVGSAAYKRAIVVMGNAAFGDAASAAQHIQVVDRNGKRVSGNWEVNQNNSTMLVLPVEANGRYQLTIGAGLSDAKGRTLGQSLKGAVFVE